MLHDKFVRAWRWFLWQLNSQLHVFIVIYHGVYKQSCLSWSNEHIPTSLELDKFLLLGVLPPLFSESGLRQASSMLLVCSRISSILCKWLYQYWNDGNVETWSCQQYCFVLWGNPLTAVYSTYSSSRMWLMETIKSPSTTSWQLDHHKFVL